MKRFTDGQGYFLSDNTASGGKREEDDLLGCGHCPKPMKKAEWNLNGGMCMVCHKPLCINCYKQTTKFGCSGPEIKKIEDAVNRQYRREQNAKVLGI